MKKVHKLHDFDHGSSHPLAMGKLPFSTMLAQNRAIMIVPSINH